MFNANVSADEAFSLLYAIGVSFSESRGVKGLDRAILDLNGGTCCAVYDKAHHLIARSVTHKCLTCGTVCAGPHTCYDVFGRRYVVNPSSMVSSYCYDPIVEPEPSECDGIDCMMCDGEGC